MRWTEDVLSILRSDTGAGGFEKVFGFLREQLIEGGLSPGDRLMSERDLATQLGVSRPILREALRSLAVLGVVEIRHGVGTIVRRPDVSVLGDFFAFATASHANLIDDVMQARIAIECQAIRLACERATVFDFEQLSLALQKIVETIDDAQSGGLADHAFHSALVTAGHSDTLNTLYRAMQELLTRSHCGRRGLLTRIENGRSYLINHHRQVFEALIARDPDQAESTLRQHFEIGDEFRRLNALSVPPAAA
jgi:GntR family transcriptional repressor for pyruvate dehydrogenase complex